ncbi:thiamine-phosphate diphosphorylase [Leptolyngbya sp. 'hensonii']|uniref:thiamine phosphate synthase n=1 Tax=Leptolyngbya sp. 'hensonii' TaxID=1922337 RepID=UPI00094FAC38|nr:thiamine phosphate synthase [Leptolyngbya sp. 'hensonii']OLP19538.1 thiamine-phosphate diphosphorylase [Leptolyngbya sp. 'hensonii']
MGDKYDWIGSGSPEVARILDANLDRAREGLRVIEEWCRFGLNHGEFTQACKHLRQEVADWHSPEIRTFRNTPGDLGTELTHPQEAIRSTVPQILQVNFARVQEALRVLEEYGKLVSPDMGSAFKRMRYRVYTLESHLAIYPRRSKLLQARLYLVTAPTENLIAVVESALQGGLTLVQYRDKQVDSRVLLDNSQRLCQLCHQYGALFIVNDRPDIAAAVDADGVHLGQQDLTIAAARKILGPDRIIGRSTTNPDEMAQAIAEGADYIGVGPVYETPTKAGKAAAGTAYVRHAVAHATVPWFAIGGIDLTNLPEVLAAGAERVAVVRAIMQAEVPNQITQTFLTHLSPTPPL